ncbi:LTA synthase family protein [Adhaeribacter aquaticus]|uniref:LTA synthase family protein n=1 Tax=Adhaeribacter aquaticus TaxID=299567 RepID=UPI000410B03F|nr:alkaline phosphatase family protein [Adhaeribacter aquaticus]
MFEYSFRILAKRLVLLLPFYLLFRITFYYFNRDIFAESNPEQLFLALLHGLRFDLSSLLTLNLPFIGLSLIAPRSVIKKVGFQQFLLFLYGILNIPFFFLNLADIEYFKFVGRRTTNELFTITQDIQDQAGQLAFHYWYLILFACLLGYLLIKLYPVYREPDITYTFYHRIQKILGVIFTTLIMVIFIRGGTQYKPLRINNAFIHEPAVVGNIALNSTFTFVRSIGHVSLERKEYFNNQVEIALYLGFDPLYYLKKQEYLVKDNVVIIIVESLASEYTGIENNGQGFTPFFDSLATKGTLFRENYANGQQSILAVPSILAGFPALMEDPFISSNYETDQLFGIGDILEPAGFTTSFFHGGANGTMGFNTFTKKIGIKHYYGLDEYPQHLKEKDYDGLWGIFDEPYLQYVTQVLQTQKQPFASTIFTLSSHDPYTIPKQHQNKFPKGKVEVIETLGYADYALSRFFQTAQQQPWYPNTLFIITGDHTQKGFRQDYANAVGKHKVPLLLFHPSKSFNHLNTHRITQHADILPTVVDYLNIKTDKLLPFGSSVFDTTKTGRALYFNAGVSTLIHQDYITQLRPNGEVVNYQYQTHNYKKLPKPEPALQAKYGQELKAYVQYFTNGLIDNNLYYWIKEK